MSDMIRSRLVWVTLAIWGAFWIIPYLSPTPYTFDLVNAFSIAVGVGCLLSFWPGFRKAVTAKNTDVVRKHLLVFGIWVATFWTLVRHAWNWVWRYLGKPSDM